MDTEMVKYLSKLSMINFSDAESEKMAREMTDIIALMDSVKDIDIVYDPIKDNHNVYLNDLRKDIPADSFPTEKILQNAVSLEKSFVVPKVVE